MMRELKEIKPTVKTRQLPFITIIILSYNSRHDLQASLCLLEQLNYPFICEAT
jgi:hypothetical protein